MKEEPTTSPPTNLKPWYYQEWFLFPILPFWPVWAVLILRSPWHNGILSGAVAWAMIFVASYWIGWLQLFKEGRLNDLTIVLIIPGLLFTIITQVHWARYKGVLRDCGHQVDNPTVMTGPLRSRRDKARQRASRPSRGSRRRH